MRQFGYGAVVVVGGWLLGLVATMPSEGEYTRNGLVWSRATRMNEIQVIGTHNSYHVEALREEKGLMRKLSGDVKDLWYGHDALDVQLEEQHVRSLELDVLADPLGGHYAEPLVRRLNRLPFSSDAEYQRPGTKVMHIPDLDIHTVCVSLVSCLRVIKAWLDARPRAVPVPVLIEFKTAQKLGGWLGGAVPISWANATLLNGLDAEIRSVFAPGQLITPDDLRRPGSTLEESVVRFGWPDLDSARGRVFFLMDNDARDPVNRAYLQGHPGLEGRVLFTNSEPGSAECAFQKLNDAVADSYVAHVQDQVRAGYWVRTSAESSLDVARNCNASQRDAALRSGAQIVSTDFPVPGRCERYSRGCGYVVDLGDGKVARCNPVNGGQGCDDAQLE